MQAGDIIFILLLLVASALCIYTNKLTYKAVFAACLVAILIYLGTGFIGIILLGCFFVLGIAATSWNGATKEQLGFAEQNHGKRNARQVLANGGVAAICGLTAWFIPEHQSILLLMIACSFSSATADTLSSELGFLYGRKFYNILTLKKDRRGENGVISIEGTLIGIAGSFLLAVMYSLFTQFQLNTVITIILAGTTGNLADSVLGATLERNNIIGNNVVNFLNTFIAALVGGLIA